VVVSGCIVIIIDFVKLEDSFPSAFFDFVKIFEEIFERLPAVFMIKVRRAV